ncbi:MAG: YolD-like family protein [Clostridia bacterium]|nr:YolD-like family protein [Clostridia bacterium]
MNNKKRYPMPISERAKIFAPFSALKGLSEALAAKEKVRVPKKELSDDMAEQLDKALKDLKTGEVITIIYYNNKEQEYIQLTGKLIKIDQLDRTLNFENLSVLFEDLYKIVL